MSAVALFLRRCAKRFFFGVRCFFFCAVAQVIVFFGVRRFFCGRRCAISFCNFCDNYNRTCC